LLQHLKSYTSFTRRNVLVVQNDPERLKLIEQYIDGAEDERITSVTAGEIALQAVRDQQLDCLVVDPAAPGLDPAALVEEVERKSAECAVPILVYSEGGDADADGAWQRLSKNPTVHWVHSLERLLDQTTMLLHRDTAKLPKSQRRTLEDMYESNKSLEGKRVLIVDDDIRNIFALTSVLEQYDMKILSADNGRDAINMLQDKNEVDVVLMDIMMPEMDGLDTTREIRTIAGCKDLPIIAVTAKAMKGDRDRCLEAGAWDYLSKPVDTEQLLAVLRLWLQR
jgi:CheY-like chemotaxis protein